MFMPINYCCCQPWLGKVLFALDRSNRRASKAVQELRASHCCCNKVTQCSPLNGRKYHPSVWLSLSTHTQGSGNTADEREGRLQEREDGGVCCETVSPSNIRSLTNTKAPMWAEEGGHQHMPNFTGEKPMRPQSYSKNYRQPSKPGSREVVFPRAEHTAWLSSTKWSLLNT